MAADSQYSQVINVQRKLYSWVLGFLGESKDTASECASGKQLVPDAKDIVGILKSTGFRLVDVTMGQYSAGAANDALCCRVVVTCAKSGLSAVLESEADCRCPEDASGDGTSAWCVMSPSSTQESDKSWNVTASSLIPSVASHLAEVVGATTRFLVQLLEDKGLATPAGVYSALGRAARARCATQELTRTPSFPAPFVPALRSAPSTMDTPGSNTPRSSPAVWVEDMQWEEPTGMNTPLPDISGLSLSGLQSLSRSETQLMQVGVIGPPRRQSSTLEDYALQRKFPGGVEAEVVFDEHMRLTEQTRVLRSPSSALAAAADAQTATITNASPAAAAAAAAITTTASAPAPAATVPYGAIAAEVSTPVASCIPAAAAAAAAADVADTKQQTPSSIKNASKRQQANTEFILPRRAQEALEKAEEFMQNMSTIMEMLKMWTMPVEDSGVGAESPRTNTIAVPAPPPAKARASPRTTKQASLVPKAEAARKASPAGGLRVSVTRSTTLRTSMPAAARTALRLRQSTPRPSAARVSPVLGVAEREVKARMARMTTQGQSPRAAAPPTASAPATTPVVSVSAPSGSPAGSPLMGPPPPPPPPPPPRRRSLDSPENPSSPADPAAPRHAASATRVVPHVTSAASGIPGRTTRRVPPLRTAPPPPPKPLKRASKSPK